jgi:hypothetical protein
VRRLARVTGLLYLVIIACAGFAEGYVRGTLVVPGDAGATASSILASEGLFRLGFAADLVAFLADAAVAVLLYVLLRPAGRTLALLAAAFRLIAHPAIASVNLLNHVGVFLVLDGAGYMAAFDAGQLEAMALTLMELHRYGYLIGGAFFGVHCALLGVLLVRSNLFPSWLGVLLGLAAGGYLIESFTYALAPGFGGAASSLVVVTAGVAEVSLCFWLLIQGVQDAPTAPDRIAGAAGSG